jgi:hypothetical protein
MHFWHKSAYGTYNTERAIARYKLYRFAGKGFTALAGPKDNFCYLLEPVLSCQSGSLKTTFTDPFLDKLPVPDVKMAILGLTTLLYGVSPQLQCCRAN